MYAFAGLTVELEADAPLLARLAPFQRPGRGELALRLCRCPPAPEDARHLSVVRCGDDHACAGDGINGRIGDREGELCVSGGDEALVAAVRLACALWLPPRGGLLLHAASVEHAGAVLVLAGRSGVGKTTLTRRLLRAGARAIGDEVACVRGGRVFGHPLQRRLGDGSAPDEGAPLAALALLAQARVPGHAALGRAEAARALLPRVFLPARDARTVRQALSALDSLVRAAPAFSLQVPDDDRAAGEALALAREAAPPACAGRLSAEARPAAGTGP